MCDEKLCDVEDSEGEKLRNCNRELTCNGQPRLLVLPVVVVIVSAYSIIVGDLPKVFVVYFVIHVSLLFVLLVVGTWLYLVNSLQFSGVGHLLEDPHHSNDLLTMLSWLPLVTAGAPCLIWGDPQDICDTSPLLPPGFLFVYVPLLDEPRALSVLCVALLCGCCRSTIHRSLSPQFRCLGIEVSSFFVLLGIAILAATLRVRMLYLNWTRTPLTASLLEDKVVQKRWPKGIDYWLDRPNRQPAAIVRQIISRRQQCREELTAARASAPTCFCTSAPFSKAFQEQDILQLLMQHLQLRRLR